MPDVTKVQIKDKMIFTKETKDDELLVYMNGKLIYKKWLQTGQSKVFDVMAYDKYTLNSISEKDRVIIASDVERDGIGIEVYRNDEMVVEIFRCDRDKVRTVIIFKETVSLDLIEESIEIFKKEIPWEFID